MKAGSTLFITFSKSAWNSVGVASWHRSFHQSQ